jgi:ABC-2 type transport system permease protein
MWIFGGEGLVRHGLVGTMVYIIGFVSMMGPIQSIAWDRHTKLKEMIVAMPVRPVSYAFGIALSNLLSSIPVLFFFMAIVAWYGMLPLGAIVWVVAVLFLCWSSLSAFSFMVATYLPKTNPFTLSTMALMLSFVIVFLPPVYYPKEMLGNFNWISFLVPTSNAAGLIRVNLGLSVLPQVDIVVHLLALISFTVFFILLASAKARWRET